MSGGDVGGVRGMQSRGCSMQAAALCMFGFEQCFDKYWQKTPGSLVSGIMRLLLVCLRPFCQFVLRN